VFDKSPILQLLTHRALILPIIFNMLIVIKYLFYILIIFSFLIFIFLNFSSVFGAPPDKNSKIIIENSKNFVAGKFLNLNSDYKKISPFSDSSDKGTTLMSWLSPPKDKNPLAPLPTMQFQGDTLTKGKFVWLGHSTLLMNIDSLIVMTDPVFNRASPVPIFGKPFSYEHPINTDNLPKVNVVIISHDHYDHLDSKAIKDLSKIVDRFLVPLGVKAHLERWGVDTNRISELDWHDSEDYRNVKFTLTPAQHFSGRGLTNGNSTLWGSWIVSSERMQAYFSGDGGYSETFRELGDRYGPFDIAFIENGAYNADWSEVHMFPYETVQANIDLKSKILFPIHWSKFDLSIHPWDEPIIRVAKEADKRNVNIATPMIGEVFDLTNLPNNPWWEALRN
jgi:L-ascorbate metabolism protein UlaG (beta-lactamase superfamily)|tara:strand:+ start:67 stop:1245 length:1179 start_codon:yes stop_codon:yes gene_type:complete